MTTPAPSRPDAWPSLPLEAWQDTCTTLHLWTQIVGKIRLAQTPWINHSWHVTLYVTARGLTTSPIPHGTRAFQIDFDFVDHHLVIAVERRRQCDVCARAADRGHVLRAAHGDCWRSSTSSVEIHGSPNEVADPIPFDRDETHRVVRPGVREPVLAHPACRRIASSRSSARASSASAARCTSSGALPTSP